MANGDRPNWQAGLAILYTNYGINGFSSFLCLSLMAYMWKKKRLKFNLYTKCVLLMTAYQMYYEVATPLAFEVTGPSTYEQGGSIVLFFFSWFGIMLGGIGSSIWAFMILACALFTVHFGRNLTLKEQFIAFYSITLIHWIYSVVVATIFTRGYMQLVSPETVFYYLSVYDYIRVTFIALSMIVFLRLCYVLFATTAKGQRNRSPLYHLLFKLAPYPITILIVRAGATFYKQIYQENQLDFPENADAARTFWFYVSVILMPSVGVFAFITFINVTAGAWRSLIEMLHLECVFTLPNAPDFWPDGKLDIKYKNQNKMRESIIASASLFNAETSQEEILGVYSQMDEYELSESMVPKGLSSKEVGMMREL